MNYVIAYLIVGLIVASLPFFSKSFRQHIDCHPTVNINHWRILSIFLWFFMLVALVWAFTVDAVRNLRS